VIITKLQVAPIELVVSSESSCAVRLARHSQNAWARDVERFESCRVESRRAKWNLGLWCIAAGSESVCAGMTYGLLNAVTHSADAVKFVHFLRHIV